VHVFWHDVEAMLNRCIALCRRHRVVGVVMMRVCRGQVRPGRDTSLAPCHRGACRSWGVRRPLYEGLGVCPGSPPFPGKASACESTDFWLAGVILGLVVYNNMPGRPGARGQG